ncbi:hypothetical protein KI387_038967, partial [Taxus chinensis]
PAIQIKMQHSATISTSIQQQSISENSSSSAGGPLGQGKDANESDEDIRRVPEMGGGIQPLGLPSTSVVAKAVDNPPPTTGASVQRKRGKTPMDKEQKRLKRLLRNR